MLIIFGGIIDLADFSGCVSELSLAQCSFWEKISFNTLKILLEKIKAHISMNEGKRSIIAFLLSITRLYFLHRECQLEYQEFLRKCTAEKMLYVGFSGVK